MCVCVNVPNFEVDIASQIPWEVDFERLARLPMRSLSVEEKERREAWQSENCYGDSETGMALWSCPLLEPRDRVSIFSFGQVIGWWLTL